MRLITHKLGFLIIFTMVASVLSISVMLPPQGITLVSLPDQSPGTVTMLAANDPN